MSSRPTDESAEFIWATRGRTWGFRFLRDGGFEDPLRVYEEAFSQVGDQPAAWRRLDGKVALRFPDPESRRDAAGRVIPHDFVLLGHWAGGIDSLEDGRQRIWREVANEFGSIWDKTEPPAAHSEAHDR